ncbi:MAG: aminodeoxychorismate lyase [Candidatus Hydrogenedentota bacterium]
MSETAQNSAPPKRGAGCFRWLFRLVLIGLVCLALLAIAGGLGAYMVYDHITRPGVPGATVTITIPEGITVKQVAPILREHGLIETEWFYWIALRIDKQGGVIKHGHYELARGLSPIELLHELYKGPNTAFRPEDIPDELKVRVAEGLSLAQQSALFDHPEAFLAAASDPDLIAQAGIERPTLEGFLMPDTYFFDKKPTEREVVERMFAHFQETYEALRREIPGAGDRDVLEVLTVASLVEEESKVDSERPLVAAVIYNRLKSRMTLDMDSTLQYALNKYGQRLLDADKQVESPYNSYKNGGLPPGPISNPGVAAIRAALQPAEVSYLYFVSNADGKTHTFSNTLQEHNQAVARFRREIAEQRREQQQRNDVQ